MDGTSYERSSGVPYLTHALMLWMELYCAAGLSSRSCAARDCKMAVADAHHCGLRRSPEKFQ